MQLWSPKGEKGENSSAFTGGYVARGFESVAHAFQASIVSGETLGAACTIMHHGETLVDLHGGWKDLGRQRVWEADDIALAYSLTKGLTGMAAAVAVSRGLFSYDDLVADIWPEFAANGKANVTVGEALSGQAGLAAIDHKLTLENISNEKDICSAIARQKPNWTPGDFAGNHAYTLGWIASELIHRCDPKGRRLPQFFADEIASPLSVDAFLGLPKTFDRNRIARIDGFRAQDMFLHHTTMPWPLIFKMCLPTSLAFKTMNNPLVLDGPGALDCEAFWRVGQGAAGGMASARGLAKLYNAFAEGGEALGVTPEVMDTLIDGHPHPRKGLKDQVLTEEMYYSHCFEKPFSKWEYARTRSAFGSFAIGGSFAFCDPEDGVSYAWITNKLGTGKWDDPREKAVRDAFYDCLENRS
ncbi:MAG: serine hydrolase domain-containing protein [Pseudomonadota bacterium]